MCWKRLKYAEIFRREKELSIVTQTEYLRQQKQTVSGEKKHIKCAQYQAGIYQVKCFSH